MKYEDDILNQSFNKDTRRNSDSFNSNIKVPDWADTPIVMIPLIDINKGKVSNIFAQATSLLILFNGFL